jgi:hypothetical protein
VRQLLENYAKAYTREKQAEKARKLSDKANVEELPSGSSKKRRKTETKAVASPKPTSREGAKGVALGAAVAAQHPPSGPSPGTRKRRRSNNLTVKIGDEVKLVGSPPVSAPQSKEEVPAGVPIQAEDADLDEDLPIDSAGSNTFWQNDGEQDAGGELPIASHFSPITPFMPATTSNEAEEGHTTASGLAIADERPTSAAEDAVPPSPFAFLWSPAVGTVRQRNTLPVVPHLAPSAQLTPRSLFSGTDEYHEQSANHRRLYSSACGRSLAVTKPS